MSKRYTLEQLLEEDPLGSLWNAIENAVKEVEESYPEERAIQISVGKVYSDAYNNDEKTSVLLALDRNSADYNEKLAGIIGVTPEDVKRWDAMNKRACEAVLKAANLTGLKKSWKALLRHSPIQKLDINNFPGEDERPFIVLFSADWCFPCNIVRPTFARLSRFYDKAKLFYCDDDELMKREVVEGIPDLAGYLPGGGKINTYPGRNTREIWNHLNLFTLSPGDFRHKATLVCDDTGCKLEVNEEEV